MRIDCFGLKIVGGKELTNGMVAIPHRGKFSIQICNYSHELKCNAELIVNGKFIGKYRVDAYKCFVIERPLHDSGRFTFYKHGSAEAEEIGLVGKYDEGSIEVTFIPEQEYVLKELNLITDFHSGGVGLSGESGQEFTTARPIDENKNGIRTLRTKLVCEDEPRRL